MNEELLNQKTELDRTRQSLDILRSEADKVLKQISEGHQKLQDIDEEKTKKLQGIYDEAFTILSQYINKGIEVVGTLDIFYSDILKGFNRLEKNALQFQSNILKTKEKTNLLLEHAEHILQTTEQVKESIEKANKSLETKIINNSVFEKSLKSQEKELQRREKIAQDKLQKAEELVLWHKKENIKIKL